MIGMAGCTCPYYNPVRKARDMLPEKKPRVIIIGAGFGGLFTARLMARSPADVTLLDRNNYHTFSPLLYQVASAELEAEDIAYPVRSIFHRHRVRFLMNEVKEIDLNARLVKTQENTYPYDYLVMAAGGATSYFGVPGAAEYTYQIKSLEYAITLRNHILYRFERAMCETDLAIRQRMLTFAIVGGGPTGVEFAGALIELIHGPLKHDFPTLNLHLVQVIVLEASDRLLPGMPPELQNYALKRLRRMGVDVRLETPVVKVTPREVSLKNGASIPTETTVWTAGVRAEPLAQSTGLPLARSGQINALPTLQVEGHPEVYVIGDVARLVQGDQPLPMLATVALQQARAVSHNLLRQINGQEAEPFRYHDPGTLATIGRGAAVCSLWGISFTGFPAWLLWLGVHIVNLIGFRNRLLVLINWSWNYFFFDRAIRLILPRPVRRPSLAPKSAEEKAREEEQRRKEPEGDRS
jgi:NADH:ubiquinone reductase (H+-translocating)